MTSSIFSLIWIREIPHLGPGCYSVEVLPYFFSKTLVSMEKDQLFLEKNEPFLMLAIFPSNENWLKYCTKKRAARAARLFFFIQPIKSSICGVVVDVAVVRS